MFKSILNLLLIIIIAFTSSSIPLNLNLFSFPPEETVIDKSLENKKVYETDITSDKLLNPEWIEFSIVGKALSTDTDYSICLEVFRGNTLIETYKDNSIVETKNIEDKSIVHKINISKENLHLPNGYYTFKIYSDLQDFKDVAPYEFKVVYLDDSYYIPAANDVERGYMYLTLYFPDTNVMYSIPTSRKVPHTRTPLRTTINNLLMGPKEGLGLMEGSPIPNVLSLSLRNRTANINLPKDLGIYDDGSAISQCAIQSFVNSITSIEEVDKVMFLQNGRIVDTMFHGTITNEPFEPNHNPKVYLGYNNSKRILLVPVPLDPSYTGLNQDEIVKLIFNSLKTSIVNDFLHRDLMPTVPADLELLDFQIEDDTLTLDFNGYFNHSFEGRDDLQRMLIDSILYSFTSIPNINRVIFKVEGEVINKITDIDISAPMTAPKYINIEE